MGSLVEYVASPKVLSDVMLQVGSALSYQTGLVSVSQDYESWTQVLCPGHGPFAEQLAVDALHRKWLEPTSKIASLSKYPETSLGSTPSQPSRKNLRCVQRRIPKVEREQRSGLRGACTKLQVCASAVRIQNYPLYAYIPTSAHTASSMPVL